MPAPESLRRILRESVRTGVPLSRIVREINDYAADHPEWQALASVRTQAAITPRYVLDLQGELAEWLEPTGDGSQASYLGQYVDALAKNMGFDQADKNVQISTGIYEHVLTSRAIRVAANMNSLIHERMGDFAALPRTDLFERHTPPRHRGFAVFEQPFSFREVNSQNQLVHAASWGYTQADGGYRGWLVALWGDLARDVDDVMMDTLSSEAGSADAIVSTTVVDYVRRYGRWAPIAVLFIARVEQVGDTYVPLSAEKIAHIEAAGKAPNFETYSAHRLMAVLWQLLAEEITTEARTEQAEGTQRVSKRGTTIKHDDVLVCTLRRPHRPTMNPGTGKKRETRSWVEGGFERTYWTGKGRTIPVRKKIGGYWSVNDESLPIKNRPRVDDLRR